MTIQVGDSIPKPRTSILRDGVQPISMDETMAGAWCCSPSWCLHADLPSTCPASVEHHEAFPQARHRCRLHRGQRRLRDGCLGSSAERAGGPAHAGRRQRCLHAGPGSKWTPRASAWLRWVSVCAVRRGRGVAERRSTGRIRVERRGDARRHSPEGKPGEIFDRNISAAGMLWFEAPRAKRMSTCRSRRRA